LMRAQNAHQMMDGMMALRFTSNLQFHPLIDKDYE
jgi:hypothetical protein